MRRPCFQKYRMPAEWSWDSCHEQQQALPEVLWDRTASLAAELFAAWSQHVYSQTCYKVLPVLLWEAEAQSPLCSTQTSPCCDGKLKSWSQVSLSRVELPLVQVKPFSNASVLNDLTQNTTANACKNRKILNYQSHLVWVVVSCSHFLTLNFTSTASPDLCLSFQTPEQRIVMERLTALSWMGMGAEWEY